jgi:hypothetical protein
MSIGPRAPLPTVAEHATAHYGLTPGDATSHAAGFTHAATHNPRSVSIATAIGKSTRRQAQATPLRRHRAGSAARCAVRSEGIQRREPSAITRQQTPPGTAPAVGPVKGADPRVMISNFHVKIDGCVAGLPPVGSSDCCARRTSPSPATPAASL